MDIAKFFILGTNSLTFAEHHVLTYVGNHLEDMSSMGIIKLAEYNNVSTTTIVRMCQKLGVQGFSEFKYRCLDILSLQQRPEVSKDNFIVNFDKVMNLTPVLKLQEIAKQMHHSSHIYIFSLGLSKTAGDYLELLLLQQSIHCSSIYDHQVIWNMDKMPKKDTITFIISNSGESKELIALAKRIKSSTTLISITNVVTSPLASYAAYDIHGYATILKKNKGDLTPHFSLILLIDLLFQEYLKLYV